MEASSKQSWKEFRSSGLLWWVNTLLHTFGWAIVVEEDDQGEVLGVYPARVPYRGFPTEVNNEGYLKVTRYMKDHAEDLDREIQD